MKNLIAFFLTILTYTVGPLLLLKILDSVSSLIGVIQEAGDLVAWVSDAPTFCGALAIIWIFTLFIGGKIYDEFRGMLGR